MTGDGRDAWLAAISARDAALGADLEGLLAEHDHLQQSGFLEARRSVSARTRAVVGGPDRRGLSAGLSDRPGRDGQRVAGGAL